MIMSGIKCNSLWFAAMRCASRSKLNGPNSIMHIRPSKEIHMSSSLRCLADGQGGTHKPTPFQRKVFLWTKVYSSDAEIPERVTRSQMKYAMDKFRVRISIGMVAMTFIFAAMMALVGRKARNEGQTITKISLARRQE